MGFLQLAGAVSGFGKGVGRGLEQMQNTMGNMQLLQIRDEMERARMRETWGHDEGMLQKRATIEEKAADVAHSRARDLAEDREDFESRRDRIKRDVERTDVSTQYERQKEQDAKKQENAVTNKVIDASYEQQKEADKAKRDRAKEERDRADKRAELQTQTGARLVEQMLQNQRPTAGSGSGGTAGKWDDQTKARYKSLVAEIADIKESLYGLVKAPEKEHPTLKKKLNALQREHDELIGRQATPSERKPMQWPE